MLSLPENNPFAIHDLDRVYLSPISWGLGDLVLSLPIVQALISQGLNTTLVLRSSCQTGLAERISGLAGVILEAQLETMSLSANERHINLRDHPLQKDVWWGSLEYYEKYGDRKINDLLAAISSDLGINCSFDVLQPLESSVNHNLTDSIALIPGSDGVQKCWPPERWLALNSELNARGLKTVMLGQPDQSSIVGELIGSIPWFETPSLADALDAISSMRGVIAVDTGLMHLAVHQLRPTVALFRPRAVYWRNYSHCAKVEAASDCDPECYRGFTATGNNHLTSLVDYQPQAWQCVRSPAESCMHSISVNDVLKVAEQKFS